MSIRTRKRVSFWLGSGTAGTIPIFTTFEYPIIIRAVYLLNGAAIAKNDTDKVTLTLYNKGTAYAGTTAIATKSTSATAVAEGVPWDIPVTTANAKVNALESVAINVAKGGSGTLTNATLYIEYDEGV